MHVRFDHVHLRSKDAAAAAQFYVRVFGAREISRDVTAAVNRSIIGIGDLILFIEQAPDGLAPPLVPPHLGIEHIGLVVDDIQEADMELRRLNVPIMRGVVESRPGIKVMFVQGPDAVQIELIQRAT